MIKLNSSFPYQKQLKNRSSKHLYKLVGVGNKNVLRTVSGAQLKLLMNADVAGSHTEFSRRTKKSGAVNKNK